MKLLAICGSPHKGNCHFLLDTMKSSFPEADMEIVMLKDIDLKPCRGCYACIKHGEDKCSLKDGFDGVFEKMQAADGVVFATPVYNNHVSGLTKQFIDRLGFAAHRPPFFGKYAMVMSVGAGFGADESNKYLQGQCSVFGYQVLSSLELYIATKEERESPGNVEKAKGAFRRFVEGVESRRGTVPEPTLMQLIYFRIFKAIAELSREAGKADYEFYKDKTDFLCDVKVGFFKRWLANYVAGKEIKKVSAGR